MSRRIFYGKTFYRKRLFGYGSKSQCRKKLVVVQKEIEYPETGEKEFVTVQKHHTETRRKIVEDLELVESDTRELKLKSELAALDEKAIRSIRAILSETATDEDKTYLARERLENVKQ